MIERSTADIQWQAIRAVIVLAVLVGGLVVYKSSSAATSLQLTAATGAIPALGRVGLMLPGETFSLLDTVVRAGTYLLIVGPALVFGILISGAVGACVSPVWLTRMLGRQPVRQQLVAGVAGAPLMLCSCCVAPLFAAIHERTGRIGPSLGVALAAPSLNPAALALTFMLFQPRIAIARLAMALVAVFAVAPLVGRLAGPARSRGLAERHVVPAGQCSVAGFVSSCLQVALRTVPLIFAGVGASMWLTHYLPMDVMSGGAGRVVAIVVAATIVVPLAFPTFFEIPLAMTLLSAGAPAGVAAAALFAGPAINLPSLLTIGRATSWTSAAITAVAIGLVACVGGLLAG